MKTIRYTAAAALAAVALAGPAQAHGPAGVVITAPPVVVAPAAPYAHVWQPGYWMWHDHSRVWVEGRWVLAPRPAPRWHRHGWERRDWRHGPPGHYGPHPGRPYGHR